MKDRIFPRFILIISVLMLLVASVSQTYAWFCNTRSTPEIQAGADATPDVAIATAFYHEGAEGVDSDPSGYRWVKDGDQIQWITADQVQRRQGTTTFGSEFDLTAPGSNNHFGTIDNLNELKQGNRMFFCIRIHMDEGATISDVSLNYDHTLPFQLYGTNYDRKPPELTHLKVWPEDSSMSGDPIWTGKEPDEVRTIAENLMYISRIACLTNKAPESFSFPSEINSMLAVKPRVWGSGNPVYLIQENLSTSLTTGSSDSPYSIVFDQDGYYYLYFEVYPNLDAYSELVQYLFKYMPCYLSFNTLDLSFAVSTQKPSPNP